MFAPIDALDFWLGVWDVHTTDGGLAGTNVVERALDGAAVFEHWLGADGSEGKSLFYYERAAGVWKQVWVTTAYVKEKTCVALEPLRFEGHVLIDGKRYPDRTTLSALAGGQVDQLIEHSLDDGATWVVSFHGLYTRTPEGRGTDWHPRYQYDA